MRRSFLLGLAGVAALATGCVSAGSAGTAAGPVAHTVLHPAARTVAVIRAASPADNRAVLAAAEKATLSSGSALWTETLLLPGVPAVGHVLQNEPAEVVGDLDFEHNRAHVVGVIDPPVLHLLVPGFIVTGGEVYSMGPDGNGVASSARPATELANADYLVQVLRWAKGPISFAGFHNLQGEPGLVRVYSFNVNLTALYDGTPPVAAQDGVLATLPMRESVWLDAQNRIAALIDYIDVAGRAVPGIPSDVSTAVLVQRFSSFGVTVYQHVDSAKTGT
jgi:hypothetical protein